MNDKLKKINPYTGIKPYPDDFEELFCLVQPQPENMAEAEKHIRENKFFLWLNKEGSAFSEAKNKMIKKGLILSEDFLPQSDADFANKYPLEHDCILIAHYFCEKERILRQVPALERKHEKIRVAMKFIQEELETLGTLPFEQNIMQHVFQVALKSLLKTDERSIFSAGKMHPYLARELVFKRAVECLYMRYMEHSKITDNFVREMALHIIDQFFVSRPTSGLPELTLKIKNQVIEQKKLLADDMTIRRFIFSSLNE